MVSFCREVLYYSLYENRRVIEKRLLHAGSASGAHALRSCMNINGILAARSRNADSRHNSLAQHPSSLTWGHPHAHSTAVCSLHGGSGTIAHALTTLSRTQGSSLIAPLTHHFTDGQFCDHTRRRPISGQRKHASRSRSRPKSHRLSEPSPLVGAYHHATTARDLRARHSSRLSL